MINKPTCYKNPDRPSCIDLILTNCPRSLQNSCVIETGLSDFHKMVVTAMKTTYRKHEPRIVSASISDPVMRSIVKYRAHPSIIAIKENFNSSTPFNFLFLDKEDMLKEKKKI